jgi:hypothetical protein
MKSNSLRRAKRGGRHGFASAASSKPVGCVTDRFDASVDQTLLFSLRENAIAKEPGLSYRERWRCVSRLGRFNGGLGSCESSPYQTLSRGALSAPSLVTPSRGLLPRSRGSRLQP